jgi:ATP synthase protein I
MFFVKALVLFVILDRLPADGRLDRRALACAVVAGALLWSGVQLRWVWTRKLYYVPPPAPPSSTSGVTPATARPGGPPAHPESPENSG